jgi:hypothetical protein
VVRSFLEFVAEAAVAVGGETARTLDGTAERAMATVQPTPFVGFDQRQTAGLQNDIIACARETEPSIVAVAVAYGERMACAVRETAGDERPVTAQRRRAASIASQTRDGVQGMSTCLTP